MSEPVFQKRPLAAHATLLGAVLSGCLLGAGTLPALAQTASEVTAPTFAPDAQRLTGAVVFSGERGTAPPAGAEKLLINLAGVTLDGGLPQMADANAAVQARLSGKTITVAEIFNAASDLENAYAQAGFVLARVVLPAQELRDGGRLRIEVIDGFVETVDTSNVPEPVRSRISRLTEPLVGRRSLRLPEIERQLLLAGDTYGVALGSALAAGATPGGTSLILQPEFRPITGFFAFDNLFRFKEIARVHGISFCLSRNSFRKTGPTFRIALQPQIAVVRSSSPARVSGSSVSGSIIATRTARSTPMPPAISVAA